MDTCCISYVHLKNLKKNPDIFSDFFLDFFLDIFFGYFCPEKKSKKNPKKSRFFYVVKMERKYPEKKTKENKNKFPYVIFN